MRSPVRYDGLNGQVYNVLTKDERKAMLNYLKLHNFADRLYPEEKPLEEFYKMTGIVGFE